MGENEIKDKILSGAGLLFMKYGVRSVSMDDIARHLGVSKKTLYQYFADKDELVTENTRYHIQCNIQQYDLLVQQSENSIDELYRISKYIRQDMENMNPSFLFDLQKFHPKAWSILLEYKNNFLRRSVSRNLKQGVEEGYFRADINLEILAITRVILVEASFNENFFSKEQFNLIEVQTQCFDHFVYGICTDKGRKLYEKYKKNNFDNKPIPIENPN